MTDEAETDMICSAIYHHDDKLVEDSPMDELLKDADVIKRANELGVVLRHAPERIFSHH